jgi:hypothetical protein
MLPPRAVRRLNTKTISPRTETTIERRLYLAECGAVRLCRWQPRRADRGRSPQSDAAPSADPYHSYLAPTPTEAPPVASMAPFGEPALDHPSANAPAGRVMTICPSTDIHRTTSLVRRVARGLGDDSDLRDQTQEIESILPCEMTPIAMIATEIIMPRDERRGAPADFMLIARTRLAKSASRPQNRPTNTKRAGTEELSRALKRRRCRERRSLQKFQ